MIRTGRTSDHFSPPTPRLIQFSLRGAPLRLHNSETLGWSHITVTVCSAQGTFISIKTWLTCYTDTAIRYKSCSCITDLMHLEHGVQKSPCSKVLLVQGLSGPQFLHMELIFIIVWWSCYSSAVSCDTSARHKWSDLAALVWYIVSNGWVSECVVICHITLKQCHVTLQRVISDLIWRHWFDLLYWMGEWVSVLWCVMSLSISIMWHLCAS